MRITTGMLTYPLFPDWIFQDKIELESGIRQALIQELTQNPHIVTPYGWTTNKTYFTDNLRALNQLIGSKFFDSARAHFHLQGKNQNIEIGESWAYNIKPGHQVPTNIQIHRWYQSVFFLNSPKNSSGVMLEDFTQKRQISLPDVQEHTHVIEPEPFKIVFFPAHIPNGFTLNQSNQDCLVITSTFVIKH